jgi:hypothetical protein
MLPRAWRQHRARSQCAVRGDGVGFGVTSCYFLAYFAVSDTTEDARNTAWILQIVVSCYRTGVTFNP